MKKLFVLLLLVTVSIISWADDVQFFIKPDATFETSNGENYVVVNVPDKSQEELYNMIERAIAKNVTGAGDIEVERIPKEMITLKGTTESIQYKSDMVGKWYVNFKYNIRFEFKNGKMRVCAPELLYAHYGRIKEICPMEEWFVKQKLATKKGEFKSNGLKVANAINEYFNGIYKQVIVTKSEADW